MKFSFVNPTQIYFGQGQIARIASAIPGDARVLVLYGGGSVKRNGVYDQVVAALEGFSWQEFAGVEPNPTAETLNRAVEQVKAEGLNYILAVGGGSVIDGAKYVAAAACYEGDGWDILLGKHRVGRALPVGVVLTLPATGSESNGGSVVTKAATQEKLNFASPLLRPRFAILDPDVMKTLPERQLANGLVDAWVHTCEQYLTMPTEAMVQEGYAEVLLRTLRTLGEQFAERDSDAWRANLMLAANQALNGFIGSGVPQDWATHMIGHELTALYGVDHGRSLAIVQPSLLRHQVEHKRVKLEQMARNVFGLSDGDALAERCIDAIEAFYHSLGVATQLTEHDGDKAAAIDTIVARLESHGMVKLGERGGITPVESREILQQAVA